MGLKLLDAIKNAIDNNKIEYWEDRNDKPNLSRTEFDEAFNANPSISEIRRADRASGDGVHGIDGEDFVYHGKITITKFGKTKEFYLKLFFWKKDESRIDQGIEIQSFRVWDKKL